MYYLTVFMDKTLMDKTTIGVRKTFKSPKIFSESLDIG